MLLGILVQVQYICFSIEYTSAIVAKLVEMSIVCETQIVRGSLAGHATSRG